MYPALTMIMKFLSLSLNLLAIYAFSVSWMKIIIRLAHILPDGDGSIELHPIGDWLKALKHVHIKFLLIYYQGYISLISVSCERILDYDEKGSKFEYSCDNMKKMIVFFNLPGTYIGLGPEIRGS